jgi:hypothetical protein
MSYSEILAAKIRKALTDISNVEEQHKMGGISFMINGKMCIRAHSDNGIMMRCEPAMTEELLRKKGVKRYEVKGKPQMNGWLLINEEGFANKKDLDFWINTALDYNNKLKDEKKGRKK